MGIFGKGASKQDLATYKKARKALDKNREDEIHQGIDYETPKFHRLNHELREAEKNVPWWQR